MNGYVRNTPLLLALALLFAPHQSRAQTVATNPVGYLQETLNPSSSGSSRVFSVVSYPLHQTPVFVGLVASVSTDTITLSSTIPSGLTASPYMVHVESSSNSVATGQSFLITASTSNSVTVSSPTFSVSAILGANDQIAIRAAETLGSIFGTGTSDLLQAGRSGSSADDVFIWNGSTYNTYYYNSMLGYWDQDGDSTSTNENNLVIYPDEGLLIGRVSTNTLPASYAMSMGNVPTNNQTALVATPGYSFVSNPLPTAVSLSQFGFTNSPSWLEGRSAGSSDDVYLWTGGGWQDYYFNSALGYWVQDGDSTASSQNNTTVAPGSGVLVFRRNALAALSSYIPIALNYTP